MWLSIWHRNKCIKIVQQLQTIPILTQVFANRVDLFLHIGLFKSLYFTILYMISRMLTKLSSDLQSFPTKWQKPLSLTPYYYGFTLISQSKCFLFPPFLLNIHHCTPAFWRLDLFFSANCLFNVQLASLVWRLMSGWAQTCGDKGQKSRDDLQMSQDW